MYLWLHLRKTNFKQKDLINEEQCLFLVYFYMPEYLALMLAEYLVLMLGATKKQSTKWLTVFLLWLYFCLFLHSSLCSCNFGLLFSEL